MQYYVAGNSKYEQGFKIMDTSVSFYCEIYLARFYGAFTLRDTETDTDTDTLAQNPKIVVLVSVPVQYEYLRTILYKPSLLASLSVSVSGSVNTPLQTT